MKKKLSVNLLTSASLFRFLIVILLVIGVCFRFVNLEKKLYWGDEVFTSLRISGYTRVELDKKLLDGDLVSVEDLHQYQYPNRQKTTADVIKGMVLEDSQILPLHVLMTRFWLQCFGNSVAVARSFSAFVSLFTFPCIYWLCKELFESSRIGWMAMGLVAISPVHVIYAQEARAYSLWIVAILISSAALLRAMRLKTKISWCIYAATLPLAFYSHILFCFVALGQVIYVVAIERFRLSKTLISFSVSFFAGAITFAPWFWIIYTHPQPEAVTWANVKQTFLTSAIRWSGIISRSFLDLGVSPSDPKAVQIALMPLILIILILIVYSIYFLCRRSSKKVWLFVLTLIGSVGFPLAVADFVFHKGYGTTRYTLPCVLGIQLACAYLFTTKITSIYLKNWQKKLWSLVLFMVVVTGILSCTISSQAIIWWNKNPERFQDYLKTANFVDQTEKPLIINDDSIAPLILGHLVDPKLTFQLVAPNELPKVTSGFSDIFLFKPSEFLKAGIEKIYNSKLQQINTSLWKITKSTET
ncbi:glycosyltransferase family 39 protein [Desmonostoc muscorum CCALA 125]|nr:glycosyltransferase family 39 protein [Desmonostoc muscorum CCALA 125]